MSMRRKTSGFGQKGVGKQAQTFAQTLLSGRPIGRDHSQNRIPKLKPRAKPVFGNRIEQHDATPGQNRNVYWGLGVSACVFALVLVVNVIVAS